MSRIIGIDLGTSTSEAAVLLDGKLVMIPNHLGEVITPSAIHLAPDGTVTIGDTAREKILLEPECTFIEVKRMIGEDVKLKAHGRQYTPQELSSFILKYLADCAGEYLNETVERVVITVPAYFSDRQRRATMEAGRLCGLKVERIINEPTAAALSYGIDHLKDCANILVYDLGGGTLDVTVLEMFEGILEVRASCGNNRLGGKDFDEAIIRFILNKFTQPEQKSIKENLRAMARLKKEAENCKVALSRLEEYTMALPFLAEINGKPVAVEETVTRAQFEALIQTDIKSTKIQINSALNDAQLSIAEIDAVLMVGGSTRIPFVEQFISSVFGKEPCRLVDPDLAVARGAAIQAAILDENAECSDLIMTDVSPYTLGTAVLRGDLPFLQELVFDPLIKRNTTIPVTQEKIYQTSRPGQTEVDIKIYQGEYRDPERNNFLGEFNLSGIPPAPAGDETVKIAFSYDANGILQVGATIVSTGEDASISISTGESEMVEEVDITKWKENKLARKFAAVIRRTERVLTEYEDDDELADLLRQLKEGLVRAVDKEELNEIKDRIVDILLELENDDES